MSLFKVGPAVFVIYFLVLTSVDSRSISASSDIQDVSLNHTIGSNLTSTTTIPSLVVHQNEYYFTIAQQNSSLNENLDVLVVQKHPLLYNLVPLISDQLNRMGFVIQSHGDEEPNQFSTKERSSNFSSGELKVELLFDSLERLEAPSELAEFWLLSGTDNEIRRNPCLRSNNSDYRNQQKTALELAIYRHWTSVVQLLLSPNSSEAYCGSPESSLLLHQAVKDGVDVDLFRFLLLHRRNSAGLMNQEEMDVFGRTVLHVAAGRNRPDIVELLVRYGSNLEAEDRTGFRPIHSAAISPSQIGTGTTRVVAILINRGANLTATIASTGMNPLHLAIISEQVGAVRLLLKAGANFLALDRYGKTPIDYAIMIDPTMKENPLWTVLAPYSLLKQHLVRFPSV